MRRATVELPGRSYDILIGPNLLGEAAAFAAARSMGETVVAVSDETVWRLHGEAFTAAMRQAGAPFRSVLVPPGEGSKSMAGLERLYAGFARAGLGRGGLVAAFGGGVVGDLAGFAAATWMRGAGYIQIPTTLLAQVDSSVGGKTAINLSAGKNLAGAFYQPLRVVADTALPATLPLREFRCGMAEAVKYGAVFSAALFRGLATPPPAERLPEMVQACCRLKSEVVREDERDTGRRMLLNFGHSFGHAIEKLGGYARHNHGEAVAMGMVLAAMAGERAKITRAGCCGQLKTVLEAQGLPTACPYSTGELLEAMALDKKGRNGGLDLILLRDIGRAEVVHHTPEQLKTLMTEVV